MNKRIKIILVVIGVLVGFILLDTVQARIFKNSPIVSWKENLEDADSWVDRGIIMDTYYCTKEQDMVTVSWKFKVSKFTCPIDKVNVDELNRINNKIIEYFSSDNVEYDNLSFNYVDEENEVVVVGLLDNRKEQQDNFRKIVVDSEFIKFIQGNSNVDHISLDELSNIQDKITVSVSATENYTNFSSCYVDQENKVVVVELVDNRESQQQWFRTNIFNSKYIKFVQGGPYITTGEEE